MNPQPAVLETAALPIELLAYTGILNLLRFLMHRVTAVMRAELLYLKPTGRKFFVLRRRVVTPLTFRAGQCNNITHDNILLSAD